MKTIKTLALLIFAAMLFGNSPQLEAQCFGTVNFDQTAIADGASSFNITTSNANEMILISYDGWGPDDVADPGPVTVDGNNATLISTSTDENSGVSEVWAYSAPLAGVHTISCPETEYDSPYYLNFASAFYATGTCTPLALSNLTSEENVIPGPTGGSISASISTTVPNSMIYCDAEINTVNESIFDISWTNATDEGNTHEGDGLDASDALLSVPSPGTYSITATNSAPDTTSEGGLTLILVAITPPGCSNISVDASVDESPTCDNNNGSATAAASGGSTPYTYNWAPNGGTNVTGTDLSAGSYTVTVTDKNGCVGTASIEITQAPSVVISISSQTDVKCNGDSTGKATAHAATGGTAPYTYLWSPSGGTDLTASGLSAGTYTITATDAHGCTASATASITQPDFPVSISIFSVTDISCFGGKGDATANAADGGVSPYTYKWTPSGGTNLNASNLSAGAYVITATDANGCTGTASAIITEPAAAVAVTISSHSGVLCNGGNTGSATAGNATGGTSPYNYSWKPSGGANQAASGLSAGTYTVTATDTHGCTATASVSITQPAAIRDSIISADIVEINCNGGSNGSATAGVKGGTAPYTYSWSPLSGSADKLSGLSAGSYTVHITDKNGCSATASITLTQPVLIRDSVVSLTAPSCFGGDNGIATIGVKGGTTPYTFTWTSGVSTTATATTLKAQGYTVTVKDKNGCSQTVAFTVTQPLAIRDSIEAANKVNINCNGGSNGSATVGVLFGTTPYTYAWLPSGGTGATASGLTAGTYTVDITDKNGCTGSASVSITQPATAIAITISTQTNVNCTGNLTGSITAHAATGGNSPYSYSWKPSGGTNLTASGLSAGSYTITATDSHGCTATAATTITQPQSAPAITITSHTNLLCNGVNSGIAKADSAGATGGTPPYSYKWTPTGGTNLTASNLSAGVYTITATDAKGCTATASVTLTQPSLMRDSMISANTVEITCNGGLTGKAKVGVKDGTSPYTYSWSPSGVTTASINDISAGTYTVNITDKNGCTSTASITLTQPSAIRDSVVRTTSPLCFGNANGTATIGVKGGLTPYTYTWTTGVSTTASATDLKAQAYTVTVKDKNGCSEAVVFSLTQPLAIRDSIVAATKVNVNCEGGNTGSATIGVKLGTSPYTYSWRPVGGSKATASGLSAGIYTVTITDKNGCSTTEATTITQPALIRDSMVSANTDNIKCNGESDGAAKVGVKGGVTPYTYSWSPVSGSLANISGLSAGTYKVHITDKNGCTSTASITLTQPAVIHDSITFGCDSGKTNATANVNGGTPPYTYAWSPGGGTNETRTGLSNGTYTITVKDKNGCSSTISHSFNCVSQAPPRGKDDEQNPDCCPNFDNVSLYPNPNTGQFTLSGLENGMLIEIYDYTGKRVSNITANNNTMQFNLSNQPNGIYLVRIISNEGKVVSQKKVVKMQ